MVLIGTSGYSFSDWGESVFKKLVAAIVCLAFLCGSALAQDAKTVIASAQKALGDLQSITYSGSAKDVAFQQCGANSTDMHCRGTHDPMRPINNYVRVIDLSAPLSRATGATNNIGAGGSTALTPGTFFQQITPQQADVSQPWANSLELYLTPWGFLKGAAADNATVSKGKLNGKSYTVLTWMPTVKAVSGASYRSTAISIKTTWWSTSRHGSVRTSWATCTSWPLTPIGRISAE